MFISVFIVVGERIQGFAHAKASSVIISSHQSNQLLRAVTPVPKPSLPMAGHSYPLKKKKKRLSLDLCAQHFMKLEQGGQSEEERRKQQSSRLQEHSSESGVLWEAWLGAWKYLAGSVPLLPNRV